MKNRIIAAICILLVLAVAGSAVFLYKKPKKSGKAGANGSEPGNAPADAKVITFVVPESVTKINEHNLQLFNEALYKDGHKYRLCFKYCNFMEYKDLVKNELMSGRADIAFLGTHWESGGNDTYELIKSGAVLNLDDILTHGRGKVLYNAFPKKLWETVKCDGSIYSLPPIGYGDPELLAVFNRNYLSDADIANWDGTMEGIYEMIANVEWDDSEAPRFQYLVDDDSFGEMIGCEIKYGLVYDRETLAVENPTESEKYIGFMKVLDRMKKDGYMSLTGLYIFNQDYDPKKFKEEVENRVKAGKFVVALAPDSCEEIIPADGMTIKRIKSCLSSRIDASIGISKNADDLDAVVDFLCLLYGDGKYSNILMYGQEGTDYKLVDGFVCNMDGSEWDQADILSNRILNLYTYLYPVSGEPLAEDRKNAIFDYYDNMELSPFTGFEPDTSRINKIGEIMVDFRRENGQADTSLDETMAAASQKLKAAGIDEYVDSIRSQWEEYRK